jgi:hypothetical protein
MIVRRSKENIYHEAIKHPVHLTVAFLDLFNHVVACDALLESLKPCFPTTLRHKSSYFYKLAEKGATAHEGPRYAPLRFEVLYGTNEVLGKRRLVAQTVAMARCAQVLYEIGDLDNVVHHLLPQVTVIIDFLWR